MSENCKPISIFPTTLWLFDLDENDLGCTHTQVCEYVNGLIDPRPPLQPGRTWQTDQSLHRLAFFSSFHRAGLAACEAVLAKLEIVHQGIEMTACWANIAPQGSLHTPHNHPNNYLSAVYYPRVSEGGDTISFHHPASSAGGFLPPLRQLNALNSPEVNIRVRTGSLIIFPSSLTHSVPPNQSKKERVSISFNIIFSDFAKTMSPPQWQGIAIKA